MSQRTARVVVAEPLRFLLTAGHRHGDVTTEVDGVCTAGHVVESLGVPRTEIGELRIAGQPVTLNSRPEAGDVIEVFPVHRPQAINEHRFVLDVHLGVLARRMRLLGIDVAYHNDMADPDLVAQAIREHRVLLTKDRGLLRRRELPAGAYVRGSRPDDQLLDVLDRFEPTLAPWTRCLTCNGELEQVEKQQVHHLLPDGTRRSVTAFSRCRECGRPYWRGAHAQRLDVIVAMAMARKRIEPTL